MDKLMTTRPTLNVFFAIGRFFISYFSVAVTSLLENNRHLDVQVYLIHDFKEVSLLDNLQAFLKLRFGITLNLVFQDIKIFQNYTVADHVSLNTYLRLLLPELIPGTIDAGVFLDSDIIITGSLSHLAGLNFNKGDVSSNSSEYLYAVREIPEQNQFNSNRLSRMGYPSSTYFNAGVLVVNLKKWREEKVSSDLLKLAEIHMDKLIFWDQDILNMYFANRWGELASTYNALHLFRMLKETPLIIHFAGSSKPWNYCNQHPYKRLYFKYWKMIPGVGPRYSDFRLKDMPYKLYKDFRHILGYIKNIKATSIK